MPKSVLIISAGMAGLTAAAYLSCARLKVDVYEQHTLPGLRAHIEVMDSASPL